MLKVEALFCTSLSSPAVGTLPQRSFSPLQEASTFWMVALGPGKHSWGWRCLLGSDLLLPWGGPPLGSDHCNSQQIRRNVTQPRPLLFLGSERLQLRELLYWVMECLLLRANGSCAVS